MAENKAEGKRSLFKLIGDLPDIVRELVQGEIELLKAEMVRKLKAAGIGSGLIAAAAIVALLFIGVLLTAAILGLALVMPGWLAALLVALVLLIVVVILALAGVRILKQGIPPLPTETIDNIKRDVSVITGVGK